MKFGLVLGLGVLAATAAAQTLLVPMRWGENGVYDEVYGCWYDSSEGTAWLSGSRDDGNQTIPMLWTVDSAGVVEEHAGPGELPTSVTSFGRISPNGQWVIVHAEWPHDDLLVRRTDWSDWLTIQGASDHSEWILAVGDSAQAVTFALPTTTPGGGFYAEPVGGVLIPTPLENLPKASHVPVPYGLSRNGNLISGSVEIGDPARPAPVCWLRTTGPHQVMALSRPEGCAGEAGPISPGGRYIGAQVEIYPQAFQFQAGFYDAADGFSLHLFENTDGTQFRGAVESMLDDGTVLGHGIIDGNLFIASQSHMPNPASLEAYVQSHGGQAFPEPGTYIAAQAVSANGWYHLVFRGQSERFYYVRVPRLVSNCRADLNGDGALNFFDVQLFLQLFSAHDMAVDFNNDGALNFFDVLQFLEDFSNGCP